MSSPLRKYIKNILLTLLMLAITFGISIALQNVFKIREHITTLFVFAVFLISLLTDGYLYGVASAFVAVLGINYAFTYPYFNVDFSATASLVSAGVMLIISILTCAFTTKLKKWQALKAENEMERMRANLLRAVSHDLRTPLTTIYGAGSSLVENYDKLDDEQKIQMIRSIKEDSEWLVRIVENLLSITRLDSGNVKLLKTPIVLDELFDTVILKFKKRYPNYEVETDLPEELVVIDMDPLLIEQVLVNIFENAVHHAKGFTCLKLRVYREKNKVFFEISDNGRGIAKEKLGQLFSGYGNLSEDNTDTHKRNAGIGLSVCASIIKAHGGDITAENIENSGACFRFWLIAEDNKGESNDDE